MTRVERIGDATLVRIYALVEEWDVIPRYVGKTVQYLHERHKAHIRDAKRGCTLPVHYWLRKQIAANRPLSIKLLEYVEPGDDWAERERHWIKHFRAEGYDLLNLTDGGEGHTGHKHPPDVVARMAAKLRTGGHFACEVCSTQFWRKLHQINKGENRFCSRRCSNARHKGRSLFQ